MEPPTGLTEDGVSLAQQQHRVQLAVDVGGGLQGGKKKDKTHHTRGVKREQEDTAGGRC